MNDLKIGDYVDIFFHDLNLSQKFIIYDILKVINKIKLQDIYRLIQTNKYFNMLLETYSGNNEYWKRRFNIFINIINGYIIFKDSPDWIQNIFLEYKTKKLL